MNWLLDSSSIMLVLLAVAFVFAIVLLVIMKSPTFEPLATAGMDDSPADAYTMDLRRQAWN